MEYTNDTKIRELKRTQTQLLAKQSELNAKLNEAERTSLTKLSNLRKGFENAKETLIKKQETEYKREETAQKAEKDKLQNDIDALTQ